MNIQYLRQSLKTRWLTYYDENRAWIERMGIWVECGGVRRPSSSFILGTLASVEPELTNLLPLVVDLSNNPDRIVMALGLNINPDHALKSLKRKPPAPPLKMLPGETPPMEELSTHKPRKKLPSRVDEECQGARYSDAARKRIERDRE
ncbi:MAG: DUF5331 domain-containing protein [Cyanobacteria bacterium J06638_20]